MGAKLSSCLNSLDKFSSQHPGISYWVTIFSLFVLGAVMVVGWCFSIGEQCFVCEYDYFKNSEVCGILPDVTFHVKMVNQCPVTIFVGASGPSKVKPREGNKWHLDPGESIFIDIPENWKHTQGAHLIGPRFWPRTGCKYDVESDKAQCETGDCGNYYDCSNAGLAGKAPASLAEFCFVCGDELTYYDISLVDGYSISVDITPALHSAERPGDPGNVYWCKSQLCNLHDDLRTTCSPDFLLLNTNLTTFNPPDPVNKIACFSNCGRYAYPHAPDQNCPDTDPQCSHWRMYCCQAFTYGKECKTEQDCTDGGACWNGACQCKAYYRNPPCPPSVCTNPGNDAQPAAGTCPDCIGDDTIHYVCPKAYTWPNDPQTYSCDAIQYIITFCPGSTGESITPPTKIPLCSTLDGSVFDWQKALVDCKASHGKFLCATRGIGKSWDCNVDKSGCDNIICGWG